MLRLFFLHASQDQALKRFFVLMTRSLRSAYLRSAHITPQQRWHL